MTDVSQALLLPDISAPSDHLLKSLAVYWDQLVLPDYVERAVSREQDSFSEFAEASEVFAELECKGVIQRQERRASFSPIDLSKLSPRMRRHAVSAGQHGYGGISRMVAAFGPFLELAASGREAGEAEEMSADRRAAFQAAKRVIDENLLDYAVRHYMDRVRDSFTLSDTHNLAPVARSAISHAASMVGPVGEAPRAEATLLSTAIQAFEIDPDTSVDRILQFREKNAPSLGRLRASLVDLSEGLRVDASPPRLLAEARDRYRNRVVPALGDLERALTAGKIHFLIRSLMGATAITLGSINPVRAVEGGAILTGQTISYSFSREKMLQEHPFGYLQLVSTDLSAGASRRDGGRELESAVDDPAGQIRSMFENLESSKVNDSLLFAPCDAVRELREGLPQSSSASGGGPSIR
jgi:hypothetical protein